MVLLLALAGRSRGLCSLASITADVRVERLRRHRRSSLAGVGKVCCCGLMDCEAGEEGEKESRGVMLFEAAATIA